MKYFYLLLATILFAVFYTYLTVYLINPEYFLSTEEEPFRDVEHAVMATFCFTGAFAFLLAYSLEECEERLNELIKDINKIKRER